MRIDGSHGEGGGQILRTALALSALTGEKLLLTNIRAGRSKPGLRAQHLAGVRAMERICGARVRGAAMGSTELLFEPGAVAGGDYLLDVAAEKTMGSAGATSLVFHALLPALSFAPEGSHLTIRGGTHVAWSPSFHHLAEVFLPTVARMGLRARVGLNRWGWYPRGGGEVEAEVTPVAGFFLRPIILEEQSFSPEWVEVLSASSGLPAQVRERQCRRLLARLAERGLEAECRLMEAPAGGAGSLVFIKAGCGELTVGFSALGERGKRAEQVADEAAEVFFDFLDGTGAVDEHLADQLVVYMALAKGESSFRTSRVSPHLVTNIWVVENFMGKIFQLEGDLGEPGRVSARGVAFGAGAA
ncbi:MAG: RNA 3'-terminal phosphate cyclase [Pseudomonadota bacterium]